jgi:hypothetical protein
MQLGKKVVQSRAARFLSFQILNSNLSLKSVLLVQFWSSIVDNLGSFGL